MITQPEVAIYLDRARENLAGAESEFENGRFNTSASRSYFAVYLAATAALLQEGVPALPSGRMWDHSFVQGEFVRRLIRQRKVYPAQFAGVLMELMERRHRADYRITPVNRRQSEQSLLAARSLVAQIGANMEV